MNPISHPKGERLLMAFRNKLPRGMLGSGGMNYQTDKENYKVRGVSLHL
jgi:hypothetical protein